MFLAAPFQLGSDACKEAADHAYSVFAEQCPGILDGVAKFTTKESVLTCTPNALAMAPKFRSGCSSVAKSIANLAVALDPRIRGGQGPEITCVVGGAFMSFVSLGECKETVAALNRALHYEFRGEVWDGGSSDSRPVPGSDDAKGNTTVATTTKGSDATTVGESGDKNAGDDDDASELYVVQSAAYELCHAPTTATSTGTTTVTSTVTSTATTHDAGELFGCDAQGHFTTRFDFNEKPAEELTTCFGHARKLNRMIGVCRAAAPAGGASATPTPGKMRCDDKVIVEEEEEAEEEAEETAEDTKDCPEILSLFVCKDVFIDGTSVAKLCPTSCKGKGRRSTLEGANPGELLRASADDVAVLNFILRDFMHKDESFTPLVRDSNGLLQAVPGEGQAIYGACAPLATTLGAAMAFFEANDYQECDWTTQTTTATTSLSSTVTSTESATETSSLTTTAITTATTTESTTADSTQTSTASSSATTTATTTPMTDLPLFKCSDFDGESLLTIEGYLECQSTANVLAGLGRLCTSLPQFTCTGLADGTFALRAEDDASCEEAVTTLAAASKGLRIGSLDLKCNGAHIATQSCSESIKAVTQAEAFLDPATLQTVLSWGYECDCPKDTAAVHFATGAPLAALEDSQPSFETADLLASLGASFGTALVGNLSSTGAQSGSSFVPTSFNLTGGQVEVDINEKLEIGQGGVCGTLKTKLQVAVSGTYTFSYGGQDLWAGTEPLKSEVPEPFSGTATIILAILAVGALVGVYLAWKKREKMLVLYPPPVNYSQTGGTTTAATSNTPAETSDLNRGRSLHNGRFVYDSSANAAAAAAADAAPAFVKQTNLFGGARGRPSMKLHDFSAVTISRTNVAKVGAEKEETAPQAVLALDADLARLPDVEVGGDEAPIMQIGGSTANDLADDYLADTGYLAENRPTNELVSINGSGNGQRRGSSEPTSPEAVAKRQQWRSSFQDRMSQFST